MRLGDITIAGFRAFPTELALDLDADAIIVLGPNGRGKTSLLDAILWGITGHLERVGSEPAAVLSRFSDSGTARVSVGLAGPGSSRLRVSRALDLEASRVSVQVNGNLLEGTAAETALLDKLWSNALVAPDAPRALSDALRRSVYLEQDRVRDFIDADSPQDRFNVIGELVGIGRVSELLRQLENEKKQWSTASNRLRKDLMSKEQELETLRGELERVVEAQRDADATQMLSDLSAWWSELRSQELPVAQRQEPPKLDSAALPIDTALRELEQSRLQLDREAVEGSALLGEIATATTDKPTDVDSRRARLSEISANLENERQRLSALENQIGILRETQLKIRDVRIELGLLADIALRHLGEHCPVCQQTYDHEATSDHLQDLVETARLEEPQVVLPLEEQVQLQERVSHLEEQQELARRALEDASRDLHLRQAWAEKLRQRVKGLGIEPDLDLESLALSLNDVLDKIRQRSEQLSQLRADGEKLALATARTHESARRAELVQQLEDLTTERAGLDAQLEQRDSVGKTAELAIEGLRRATEDLVEKRLAKIGPLLNRLYARIDPHVEFRAARFLTSYQRGRGHLSTELTDVSGEHRIDDPENVLSSSQMNALAVSVFLSFNLGLDPLPLDVAILDDPLQSLDDVNLLGLVDTLRRTRDRRQLIVSTHDRRLGELLQRKLRPVRESQRTIVLEFEGWDRTGPIISQRELAQADGSLRVVA